MQDNPEDPQYLLNLCAIVALSLGRTTVDSKDILFVLASRTELASYKLLEEYDKIDEIRKGLVYVMDFPSVVELPKESARVAFRGPAAKVVGQARRSYAKDQGLPGSVHLLYGVFASSDTADVLQSCGITLESLKMCAEKYRSA